MNNSKMEPIEFEGALSLEGSLLEPPTCGIFDEEMIFLGLMRFSGRLMIRA